MYDINTKVRELNMKRLKITDGLEVSQLSLGCMRISDKSVDEVEELINTALELGIDFFDHADIYGGGVSESLFGEVLKRNPGMREKMIIQSKCGIRKGFFDFSKEHILNSVEKSIERLQCGYLDVLLLHRPDTLMDPKEVAEAFSELYESGKVKYFGVSNMNPMQIKLIEKESKQKMLFNQLQFNVVNAGMIDSGINVNMDNSGSIDHDGSILEYCRLHDITIQPWSIMQASWEKGCFLDHKDYPELNKTLEKYADQYQVSKAAISLAWIIRHSANMQPIAGTTSPSHLKELCKAFDVNLTRQEWYELYCSVGRMLP